MFWETVWPRQEWLGLEEEAVGGGGWERSAFGGTRNGFCCRSLDFSGLFQEKVAL